MRTNRKWAAMPTWIGGGKRHADYDKMELAVLAEARRVVAESWDVLVTLRKFLHSRLDMLQQLLDYLAGKIGDLEEQHKQAFEKACKAIGRANRDYLKAEPARVQAWVEEQAESDDAVVALEEQIAPLQALREKVASASDPGEYLPGRRAGGPSSP